jgi:hypothetical protein
VVLTQQHFRVIPERQPGRILVVLRRYGEHDAAIAKRERAFLHCKVGLSGGVSLAYHDAFQPIVANDAAPERIVKVKDQAAPAEAAKRGDEATKVVGVERDEVAREWQLRQVPQGGIVPVREPNSFGQAGDVKKDILVAGNAIGDGAVEGVDDAAPGTRKHEVETTEVCFSGPRDGLQYTERLAIGFDAGANLRQDGKRCANSF